MCSSVYKWEWTLLLHICFPTNATKELYYLDTLKISHNSQFELELNEPFMIIISCGTQNKIIYQTHYAWQWTLIYVMDEVFVPNTNITKGGGGGGGV
jgi:hypothetical protein